MPDEFPQLHYSYSRRAYLGFATGLLILVYGGIGMVAGLIAVEAGQRTQQIMIGWCFLALAAVVGVLLIRMIRAAGKPVLTLDRDGLWDRRLTTAPIPWTAIAGIERVDTSFFERMILLGSQSGKLLVRIAPKEWDRIPFIHKYQGTAHALFLAGENRLRIFHKALDTRYPQLFVASAETWRIARERRSSPG